MLNFSIIGLRLIYRSVKFFARKKRNCLTIVQKQKVRIIIKQINFFRRSINPTFSCISCV